MALSFCNSQLLQFSVGQLLWTAGLCPIQVQAATFAPLSVTPPLPGQAPLLPMTKAGDETHRLPSCSPFPMWVPTPPYLLEEQIALDYFHFFERNFDPPGGRFCPAHNCCLLGPGFPHLRDARCPACPSLLVPTAEGSLQKALARCHPYEAGEAGTAGMRETRACQFGPCLPGDSSFPPAFFYFGFGLSVCLYF